jgi:hypothetical protein
VQTTAEWERPVDKRMSSRGSVKLARVEYLCGLRLVILIK